MTLQGKREYYQAVIKRYHKSGKKQKGIILSEFCAVTGLNRSYAIRLMNDGYRHRRKKPGRRSKYDNGEFRLVLARFWSGTQYLCGKLLKAAIPAYLPFYEELWGEVSSEHRQLLLQISPATIDRVLKPNRVKSGKGKSLTKGGKLQRQQIPILTDYWSDVFPGYMETDTVAHCGSSVQGPFIWTLTMTDIATSWTENRAVWTRNADNTIAAIRDIKSGLPFRVHGLDCDNGSEFLNEKVIRFCAKEGIALTRSRPYKKNDNAHVEQKNYTTARQLFGYGRLENPDLVPVMNDIYANEWSWFNNFFRPCFKLKEKIKVGSKYKRIYDTPKTPYQRVLESTAIPDEVKDTLREFYATLNPFKLQQVMDKKLQRVKKLAKVTFEEWSTSPAGQRSLNDLFQ